MATLIEKLSTALADRYAIERELGSGGMAIVFLARDLRHDRQVALKVLRPELAAVVGADRFIREIRIAARLQHPHIVGVHDSGEADGLLFYVMPYVEGETLRSRLDRERQLSCVETVRIGREVADALAYAHEHQVVHRDIKPENILLSSGHAVVADFGIARAVSVAGGDSLTSTGITLGTPDYMSPEQAAADAHLDRRSDVYSLGVVLYEALVGVPPFSAATPQETIAKRFTASPPAVSASRESVPAELNDAISRAMARLPSERYDTAAEFAEALRFGSSGETRSAGGAPAVTGINRSVTRWIVAAVPVLAVVLILGRYLFAGDDSAPPRVAVLPFSNVGPAESEYFADGITEEMSSRLAEISGLQVTSRTSSLQYKGTTKTIREIGSELRVDYVLEGTVRTERAPDGTGQVRVIPQLIRVSDDANMWSGRYDTSLVPGALITTQATIAEQVANALNVALVSGERDVLGAPPTEDAESYDAYLLGRYHWNRRTLESIDRAIEYFEDAIARDSSFAAAWAGLADALVLRPFYGVTGQAARNAFERAKVAAREAIRLAPDNAEAHASLGEALLYNDRNWEAAEEAFIRAIELDPGYPVTHYWYGELLAILNRIEEAVQHTRRALELAPTTQIAHHLLGLHLMQAGEWDAAIAAFRRSLEVDPDLRWSHVFLGLAALHQERWDDGRDELVLTGIPEPVADVIVAARRDSTRMLEATTIIEAYARGATDLPFSSVRRYLYGLSDIADSTVVWLIRGIESGSGVDLLNMTHPVVGRAATDPRILELRRELGLPN